MKIFALLLLLCCSTLTASRAAKEVTKLQIGVKHKPAQCVKKATAGDSVSVHYTGKLTDGSVFDSSVDRGQPFEFKLGAGQVIKGWDQGIAGMCIGEKRRLKIPASLGYGEHGSPPKIPGGATLIFETELMGINGETA
ncbi:g10866 [Coccomyxa elongata]